MLKYVKLARILPRLSLRGDGIELGCSWEIILESTDGLEDRSGETQFLMRRKGEL